MNDKLTRKSQEAVSAAVRRATTEGNPHVEPLHLLAALISLEGGTAAPLLRAVGADPAAVLRGAEDQIARLPKAAGTTVSAPDTARPLSLALATAAKRAREMGDEYVSTEHLLVGLAADGGQAADLLRKAAPVPTNCSARSRRSAAAPGSGRDSSMPLCLPQPGFGDWPGHTRLPEYLAPQISLPAIGQGALGIEGRRDDLFIRSLLSGLDHAPSKIAVRAERALLHRLQGGCQVPIAAYATVVGTGVRLEGLVSSVDGKELLRDTAEGTIEDPESIGIQLAEQLLARGGDRILQAIYGTT